MSQRQVEEKTGKVVCRRIEDQGSVLGPLFFDTQLLPVPKPHLLFTLNLITAMLYYNLPKYQIHRLQVIHNSLAQAVVKAPKFCHVTPILKSLHWLKINERIEYKLLSLT